MSCSSGIIASKLAKYRPPGIPSNVVDIQSYGVMSTFFVLASPTSVGAISGYGEPPIGFYCQATVSSLGNIAFSVQGTAAFKALIASTGYRKLYVNYTGIASPSSTSNNLSPTTTYFLFKNLYTSGPNTSGYFNIRVPLDGTIPTLRLVRGTTSAPIPAGGRISINWLGIAP